MCGLTYSQNERVGPMAWKYIYVSVVPVSRRQNSIVQKSNVRVVDDILSALGDNDITQLEVETNNALVAV